MPKSYITLNNFTNLYHNRCLGNIDVTIGHTRTTLSLEGLYKNIISTLALNDRSTIENEIAFIAARDSGKKKMGSKTNYEIDEIIISANVPSIESEHGIISYEKIFPVNVSKLDNTYIFVVNQKLIEKLDFDSKVKLAEIQSPSHSKLEWKIENNLCNVKVNYSK